MWPVARPWAGNSPAVFEAKFWGTESWRHSHNSLPAIKNKPSSTLTTGNVGVNIVKMLGINKWVNNFFIFL
ncbi:hypothetical protein NQ317_006332 [Molorchus minor]|uniref:Uncharacterized protein n=1 Tax=Molorchus minor TaxID=1323400 RepID=A0ABQ9J5A5_9CUCU|nr:hypothetical protein NQ317_006332 [Molorchus minor]